MVTLNLTGGIFIKKGGSNRRSIFLHKEHAFLKTAIAFSEHRISFNESITLLASNFVNIWGNKLMYSLTKSTTVMLKGELQKKKL